jgi:hypothetical protein
MAGDDGGDRGGAGAECGAGGLAGRRRRRTPAPLRPSRTAEHLWEVYRVSPKYARKAKSTRDDYRRKAAVFLAEFGSSPVAAIDKAHLYRWWEELSTTPLMDAKVRSARALS